MQEVEIKFERENLEGLVAVGTYLSDAARRFGIYLEDDETEEKETAAPLIVKIVKGGELLSAPTSGELELLSNEKRTAGERVAAQAKIEKSGEIVVMTTKKKKADQPSEEAVREAYRKEFEELPLEKKISSLVELEAIALGDTFSFILNSPYKIVGKIIDVMAEFGLKIEDAEKKQSRPAEHQNEPPKPSVDERETEKNEKTAPEPSVDDRKLKEEPKDPLPSV